MKTQKQQTPKDTGVTEYSRNFAEERYFELRAYEHRKKVTRIAIIAGIAAVICGILIGAALYVNSLNSRITTKDAELLSSLTTNVGDDPFYMLLLGVDKGEERLEDEEYGPNEEAYRADTIMLCRIDPKDVKATIVSIHRDLLVDLPDGTEGKINNAYSLKGASGMVKTVSNLADVKISHYAEIDFDAFMGIVDSIGGVEVTLPVAVRDPEYTKLDLDAGTHTLNGHDALMLCRSRHAYDDYGDGDLYRAANQRAVIGAIVKKVLKSDPATMVSAISSMAESLTTDMTVDEILGIAAKMRDFDTENDLYAGMTPTTEEVIDDIYYEVLDEDEWKIMMRRVDQGLPPYSADDADHTKGIAGNTNGDMTVSANAVEKDEESEDSESSKDSKDSKDSSKKDGESSSSDLKSAKKDGTIVVFGMPGGSASAISDELSEQGFTSEAQEVTNTAPDGNVVVYGDATHKAEAEALAKHLGTQFDVMENDGNYYLAGDIVIWVTD